MTTRDLPLGGLEIFRINALKRAGRPRRASKSKLRTHDKVCLGQHFFWITFHFTSFVCLCVGYKMKTCTQISNSGFRGKINVVNPGDSAWVGGLAFPMLTRGEI